jgi:hypothetical protein
VLAESMTAKLMAQLRKSREPKVPAPPRKKSQTQDPRSKSLRPEVHIERPGKRKAAGWAPAANYSGGSIPCWYFSQVSSTPRRSSAQKARNRRRSALSEVWPDGVVLLALVATFMAAPLNSLVFGNE